MSAVLLMGGTVTSSITTHYRLDGATDWTANHGQTVYGVVIDSQGNAWTAGLASSNVALKKYDPDGSLLLNPSYGAAAYAIAVDGDDVIYLASARGSGGWPAVTTRKIANDGTITWTADHGDPVYAIAVDSSGNVYTGGVQAPSTTTRKYNSSGTEQATSDYGGTVRGIAVDSSGNVYECGDRISNRTVRKLNSSLVEQWTIDTGSGTGARAYAIALDASETHIYVGINPIYDGAYYSLFKYRLSDQSLIWRSASYNEAVYAISLDGSGNIYTVGSSNVLRLYDADDGALISDDDIGGSSAQYYGVDYRALPRVDTIPALALPISLGTPYQTGFVTVPALAFPISLGTPSTTEWSAMERPATAIREVYRLILSGLTSTPVIAPLRGIQCTQRADASTWMTATIGANSASLEAVVAAYLGSEMLMELGYGFADGSTQYGAFLRATITDYDATETAAGLELSVTGRVINPSFAATTRTLTGISRIQTDAGRWVVTCAVDPFLRPNDTAVAGSTSWTVGTIDYRIDAERATMTVTEASDG